MRGLDVSFVLSRRRLDLRFTRLAAQRWPTRLFTPNGFLRFSRHDCPIIGASMTSQHRADNDLRSEPTIFSAVITPHRSLSNVGFVLVMTLIGCISFTGGMFFYLIGAWPVVGFLGL